MPNRLVAALIACAAITVCMTTTTAAVAAASSPAGDGQGIELTVTAAPADPNQPDACAADSALDVSPGEQINICYTVTSHADRTLVYHGLSDDLYAVGASPTAPIFSDREITLAPGARVRYNRVVTVGAASETVTATWSAADSLPNYTVQTSGGSLDSVFANGFDAGDENPPGFIDITGIGDVLDLPAHNRTVDVPLPFPLTVFGKTTSYKNALCVTTAGSLFFTESLIYGLPQLGCGISFLGDNTPLPTAALPADHPDRIIDYVFPYWDQLGDRGLVYAAQVGFGTDRKFVVEWDGKNYGGDPNGGTITFEVVFNQSDASIDFIYADTTFGGQSAPSDHAATATVGLQSTERFVQYSYDEPAVVDGMRIHFAPTPVTAYAASAELALHVVAPHMLTTPTGGAGFSPVVAAGGSTTATLSIDNSGDATLAWTLAEASPTLHFPVRLDAVDVSGAHRSRRSPRAPSAAEYAAARESAQSADAQPSVAYLMDFAGIDANDNGLEQLDRFHLDDPANMVPVGAPSTGLFLPAGDFVNNDFSREIVVPGFLGFPIQLYGADTATGALDLVAQGDVSRNISGLRWDATSGRLYAIADHDDYTNSCHSDPDPAQWRTGLYVVDPATADSQYIGAIPGCMYDIAIDRNGSLFAIGTAGTDLSLYAIDKTTGYTQRIAPIDTSTTFTHTIDFDDASGALHAVFDADGGQALFTIDTISGHAAPLGRFPTAATKSALAIAAADPDPCAAPSDVPWLSFDSTSGETPPDPDQTAPSLVTVTFDAGALAPGMYSANVCVFGNDPANRRVSIPVHFTVQ